MRKHPRSAFPPAELTHHFSVYSSYEHSLLNTTTNTALPLDITLELLLSTLILCVGIVLSSPALMPIQWRTWAADASLDDNRPKGKRKFETKGDGAMVGNPFRYFEEGERRGFVDVVGRRREFAGWVREGSGSDPKVKS